MNWLIPSISATLISTIFLFFIYLYLYSTYRQKYLMLWSISWLVYSIRFLLEIIGAFHPSWIVMISVQMITLASGIILLMGTYEFIRKKIPEIWIALCLIGLIWIPVAYFFNASFLVVTAPGFTLLALIYAITGTEIIKSGAGRKKTAIITGTCFILWGIHKANYPFFRTVEWLAPAGFLIGAVLSIAVALGILLIFFESLHARLKESEKTYRSLFDGTNEAIFVHDPETGKIIDVNMRMTEMYGCSREEAVNLSISDLSADLPEYSLDSAFARMKSVTSQKSQLFEWLAKRKDGTCFWVEVSLLKTRINENNVILATVRDITERKEAERELNLSRRRFQEILEGMPLIAVTLNCDGKVVFANSFLSRVSGWETEELEGADWFEKMTPDQPGLKSFFTNTCLYASPSLPIYNENDIITKTGDRRCIRWSNIINHDASGQIEGVTGIGEDITERMMIDEALHESETLYRSVIEASADGFWITDMKGRILGVNEAYCRLSGYSREELLGIKVSELEASETPEVTETHIRQVMRNGSEIFESIHRKKDGTLWHVEINACYHNISGGRFFVFIRDLFRRKKSEVLLKIRSELLDFAEKNQLDELMTKALDYAELMTGSFIGFFHFVDEDQKHISLQAWSTNTKKNMCKAEGKGFHYPIKDAGVWADCFYERAPVIHNDYSSLPHKKGLPEGHAQILRELVVPIIKNDIVIGIIGVGNKTTDYDHDDTETMQTLASIALDAVALKKAENDLKESEANLRLAQQIAVLSRWEYNHRAGTVFWSKGVYDLLESETGSMEPSVKSLLQFVHHEDAKSLKRFSRCIIGGTLSKDVIIRIITVSGKIKWVRIVARTETDETGKALRTIGTAQDVTALKQAEIERQELERQMLHVQKLESLGVLAGGMAHDFNNILTAILGHSEIAMMGLSPEDPAIKSLYEIGSASRRAAEICHQMLAYAGRGKFVVEPVFLGGLISEMADLLRTSISKNASLNVNISGDLPPINADATQVRQVVMNLITNASDAIGDKSGIINITTGMTNLDEDVFSSIPGIEEKTPGEYVYVEVTDTGCGMDKETINRIFEPFFTTKFTGRGLGMAAVLGIIKSHRGFITIRSKPGEGSTFKLFFPPCDLSVKKDAEVKKTGKSLIENGLVLFADDEAAIRTVGKKILEKMGLSVLTAPDGKEAVSIFNENRDQLDLAIIDLTMPFMDGAAVFAEIRKQMPDLPVIIISGYTEYEIKSQFTGKNVTGFIQKPFSTREMTEKVSEALGML